jgi:predicted phage-related endonuclease
MLSKKAFADHVDEYLALDEQIKELQARQDALKNEMTGEMERKGVTELVVGNKILRWTSYVQDRFDSSGFRKAFPEIYASWKKQVTGHRFTVS